MEKDINNLIRKYNSNYVKGEIFSSDRNKQLKREQRTIEKHNLCDELFSEININFTPFQKDFVHYLIDRFSVKFKKLHGRAKNETIILVFMFFTKKLEDSHIDLNNYSISKKYGLNDSIFKLVVCRICGDYIDKSPMIYKQTTKYNHEILSKNGGKP